MLRALLMFLVGTAACLAEPVKFGAVDSEGWRLVRVQQGYPIEYRAVAHSRFPQIRIRALIPATPSTVYKVISDYDHFAEFVPNVLDSRSISQTHEAHLVFQRLHFAGPLAGLRYVVGTEIFKSHPTMSHHSAERISGKARPHQNRSQKITFRSHLRKLNAAAAISRLI